MATSLTIATGPLTTSISTADDTAAQNVLQRFAHATGAPAEWTPQQKLDHVAAALAGYMVTIARERYILEESETVRQEAQDVVHW